MKALILAGGYGTRLYPLIKDTPKALLEVNGKELINYILDKIEHLKGLNEVLVVTNDKFEKILQEWAGRQTSFLYPITIINDGTSTPEDRLGSIGDIDFAIKKESLNDDVLVLGSDNLFDFGLDEFFNTAVKKPESVSIGLYDVGDLEEAAKFGVVGLSADQKIISFIEKPAKPESTLIAMCMYYLPQKTLGFIRDYLIESQKSDTAGDYIRWLHESRDVYGFKFTGKWYDIGSIESYEEAQKSFL